VYDTAVAAGLVGARTAALVAALERERGRSLPLDAEEAAR